LNSELNIPALVFHYKNWRGETSIRRVKPLRVWFGSTEWHPKDQWFLEAEDIEKGEKRDFALNDMIFGGSVK
jgi:predicted DNA-binding transcriptional regulator YafY